MPRTDKPILCAEATRAADRHHPPTRTTAGEKDVADQRHDDEDDETGRNAGDASSPIKSHTSDW